MKRFLESVFPSPWLDGLSVFLVLFITLGLPLLVLPASQNSFDLPKESLFQVFTLILLAVSVAAAAFNQKSLRIYIEPVNAVAVLYVLWHGLSIFWSAAPVLAWEETVRTAILVLFFFLFQSIIGDHRRRLLSVIYVLAIASLIVAAQVIVQDFRQAFTAGGIPVRSVLGDWRDSLSQISFGNTSHLADFLVIGMLVWFGGLLFVKSKAMKVLVIVSLTFHAAALIVCWSVHSNLSLIIAFALGVWLLRLDFYKEDLLRMKGRLACVLVCWVLAVGFYVVDHPLNPHGSKVWAKKAEVAYIQAGMTVPDGGFHGGIFSQAFSSTRWTEGLDTRLAIWMISLEMVKNNTWFGCGAGNFTYVYPETISELVLQNEKLAKWSGSWTNAAHNEVLQTWAELGIIGALLLVLLVALSLKASWDRLQEHPQRTTSVVLVGGMCLLVAICLQSMMNFPLQLPVSSALFFCLLAIPFIMPIRGTEDEALMVPVERPIGSLRIGVIMKNMARPVEFSAYLEDNKALSFGAVAMVVLFSGYTGWQCFKPLRADLAYKDVYETKQRAQGGFPGGTWDKLIPQAKATLSIWPGHVDCRSTLQDALLRINRFNEVIEQTPLVLEKLNSVEVYQRRANALVSLGRGEEAQPDFEKIFRRRPGMGALYPRQYREFLTKFESTPLEP